MLFSSHRCSGPHSGPQLCEARHFDHCTMSSALQWLLLLLLSLVPSKSVPHADGTHEHRSHHFFFPTLLPKASLLSENPGKLWVSWPGTWLMMLHSSHVHLFGARCGPLRKRLPIFEPQFPHLKADVITPSVLYPVRLSAIPQLLSTLSGSPLPKVNNFQRPWFTTNLFSWERMAWLL